MSFNLIAPAPKGRPDLRTGEAVAVLDQHTDSVRKTTTMNSRYYHVQELQRERLRQAEDYRLQRLALRARRAVAGQLVR